MTKPDSDFDRIIKVYLDAGMPAKHGLSPDEYVSLCRSLWDQCETDEQCPYKVLIDRLHRGSRGAWDSAADYVDPRSRAANDIVDKPTSPIHCIAMGAVPLVDLMRESSEADVRTGPSTAEPDASSQGSKLDAWILGLFDVLGCENMYRRLGPQAMQTQYGELMECVAGSVETTAVGMRAVTSDEESPVLFHFELGTAHFSDTIMLWAPLTPTHISPFLTRCADLVGEAARRKIPLRGAVGVGEAILDTDEGTYIGGPIIEAARLERAQDWLGVSLSRSLESLLQYVDSDLVLPFTPLCKPEVGLLHAGVVLDWPRRLRASESCDVVSVVRKMRGPSRYDKYYDNAELFAIHSEEHQDWNRDKRIPVVMGALRRSIIRQALGNEPLPEEAEAMLQAMESYGGEDLGVALCPRAIGQGLDLPTEASSLSAEPLEFLKRLREVCGGRMIDVDAALLSALEVRTGVRPRDEHLIAALEPSDTGDDHWKSCVPCVEAIAASKPLPPIPPDLPPELEQAMESAYKASEGKSMPVDLETLVAGVMWCNTMCTELSGEHQSRIEALQRAGHALGDLAAFLDAVARGEDVQPDLSQFDEGVLSTIEVVDKALAWQKAVRCSFVEAASRHLTDAVSSDDLLFVLHSLRTGKEVHAPQESFIDVLDRLVESGSPHDAVGRFLQQLVQHHAPECIPGGLPGDAQRFLSTALATVLNPEHCVPIEALIQIAIAARREQRALSHYECALYSLAEQNGDHASSVLRCLRYVASCDEAAMEVEDLPPEYRALFGEIIQALARLYRPHFASLHVNRENLTNPV